MMNAIQWLNSLRPALPMSIEQPCKPMSNGELRRHMQQGGVLVNGERLAPDERIDFLVFSLVFFPKSASRRTTLV
jgi:L-alanine-DL-glutamate epimerase-like enolase superfamily enzyme